MMKNSNETRLLVITQAIDKRDATLGFFHGWISELAERCEKVSVICLFEGEHDLPQNVSVYSLGKESGVSRVKYLRNFFHYVWKFRDDYNKVFVHMNQEYVLLGAPVWKILGKKIFFWRNHPRGGFFTLLAIFLSDKVFATAKDSFTGRFKKTVLMPVGVDTDLFREDKNISKTKNSICMVGRIAPIKKIDLCLSAVSILIKNGVQMSLSVLGPCEAKNIGYLNSLKDFVSKNGLSPYVRFLDGVGPENLPAVYNSHETFVNLTRSGSFDKTIVEACACGLCPLVSNISLSDRLPAVCFSESRPEKLAKALETLLRSEVRVSIEKDLKKFAEENSLKNLVEKIMTEMEK